MRKKVEFDIHDENLIKLANKPISNLADSLLIVNLIISSINLKNSDIKEIRNKANFLITFAGILITIFASSSALQLLGLRSQQIFAVFSSIVIGLIIMLVIVKYLSILSTVTLQEQNLDIVTLKNHICPDKVTIDLDDTETELANSVIKQYVTKLESKKKDIDKCQSDCVRMIDLFVAILFFIVAAAEILFVFIPEANKLFNYGKVIEQKAVCSVIGKASPAIFVVCVGKIDTQENTTNKSK